MLGVALPPVHRIHVAYMLRLAVWALDHTVRPADVSEKVSATLPVGEVMNRIYQRLR